MASLMTSWSHKTGLNFELSYLRQYLSQSIDQKAQNIGNRHIQLQVSLTVKHLLGPVTIRPVKNVSKTWDGYGGESWFVGEGGDLKFWCDLL